MAGNNILAAFVPGAVVLGCACAVLLGTAGAVLLGCARAVLLCFAGAVLLGCGAREIPGEAADESSRFENIDAEFVGDEACFDCHEEQYRGFQEHGMAQSFYPLTPANVVEDFSGVVVHHEGRDLSYRVFREGDRFYQEEYRMGPAGEKVHSLVREMELVVGSGTAARTYLVEENDRYYELPLTWYTQEERWAFSPGYVESNLRFDRLIPDRCMSCHNSYPEPVSFADGKYKSMPHGIGCERCHGPGSVHVDARLASPEPSDSIDETIVNPAHLSLERRLDVCQQCHLSATVSILREGRSAYDYRPSQRLDEYVALFASASEDEIDVISHADRMRQSECFIQTQSRDNPMDCLTCHDPHEGFRAAGPEYFNVTCRTCHDPADLQEAMPSAQTRAAHASSANCHACHMPKYEGTPHASFTDHNIRVVREVAERSPVEAQPVRLDPYFERDREDGDVYRGMAYVVYGRQQGDSTALQRGIRLLRDSLPHESEAAAGGDEPPGAVRSGARTATRESASGPEASVGAENASVADLLSRRAGEAYFLVGFAHLQLGQVREAIPPLETAVTLGPGVPERLNSLAQAYEADRRDASTIRRLYERALSIQPALADVRVNYGRFLEAQGHLEQAVAQYRTAANEQPWLETAHYNLGTALLRSGDLEAAEAALREAIHLNPDHVDALGNLGLLLAASDRPNDARSFFERAVRAEPQNPVALGNLGAHELNAGNLNEAVSLLTRAVERDASYVDGLVNLALAYFRMEEYERARPYAERALRIAPDNQRARQILDAL